ncbi:deoxynucleotide monophosphate kinase family protein [Streptomyces sp. NBC_01198]|uniref:deoxynucleotide monophosphate kinase family protein n=1 Tax=Streptomyces sp. NBC_01198 TaxID=2903769 RepID=UPI002E13C044|nr:hypothetical protein OG702_32245 [Streptomyces sp. NBC_01198]
MIIGLSGYARSGKDETAKALGEWGWRREGFADPLRAFLLAVDPLIPGAPDGGPYRLSLLVEAYGWERVKDEFPEVRALLQRTGTEAGRTILGGDVWINALFRDHEVGEKLVIPDVRFPNEAMAIRSRGGVVLRIERLGVEPAVGEDGEVHDSETALDDWAFDGRIHNDGTIEDLRDAVHGELQWVAQLH